MRSGRSTRKKKTNQRKKQLRPKNAKARTLFVTRDEKHGQHWRVTHCTLHPGPVPSCPGQLGSGSEVGSPRLPSALRHRLRYRHPAPVPASAPGRAGPPPPAHFPTLCKRVLSPLCFRFVLQLCRASQKSSARGSVLTTLAAGSGFSSCGLGVDLFDLGLIWV